MSTGKSILKGFAQFLLTIAIIAALFLAINATDIIGEKQMRVFGEYLSDYTQAYGTDTPTGPATGVLSSNVKAIFISQVGYTNVEQTQTTYSWRGDTATLKIPKDYRAASPEELNTLMMITHSLRQVGIYTNGGRAYVNQTWITILNAETNEIIIQKLFEGGNPPLSKTASGDATGSSPNASAIDWAIQYIKSGGIADNGGISPTAEATEGAAGICWTRELSGYSGNRAEVWEKFIAEPVKALVTYEQFLQDVAQHNPTLEADGFVFSAGKVYTLPQVCP